MLTRTIRALERDPVLTRGAMAAMLILACAWALWFAFGRTTVYLTSVWARLEPVASVRPLEFEVSGRVTKVNVELGDSVAAGDILFELDQRHLAVQLAGERARREATNLQMAALGAALSAEAMALRDDQRAASEARREAAARMREVTMKVALIEKDVGRARALYDRDAMSQRDREELETSLEQQRSTVEASQMAIARMQYERNASARSRQVALENLRQRAAEAEAILSTVESSVGRLEREIERHRILAPVGGRIGELSALRPGDLVDAGFRVGSLVPKGPLKVVALFRPELALGRIQVGHRGRIRLDGFSWTEYGSLESRVVSVADETRDGKLRVDLELVPTSGVGWAASTIPLQHGLTGTADVAVDRISPAVRVLRVVGLFASPGLRL